VDVEDAKTAILERLCYDYKRYGRGFGLAAFQIQQELKIPGGVFWRRAGRPSCEGYVCSTCSIRDDARSFDWGWDVAL